MEKYSDVPCLVHHHVVTDVLHDKTLDGEKIVNTAKRFVFVSRFAMNYARKGTNEQNDKMIFLPNSVDVARFRSESRECIRREIRRKYGIGDNDIVVLFVGRMVRNKGTFELIQAMALLHTNRKVKVLVVGGATYNSKKKTQYVSDCLDAARNNPNIILAGSISYDDIPKYYMASDISTLLSRCDEACGLVGIESMAAGLPVITTDRGGIPEYVAQECKIAVSDDETITENIAKAIDLLADNADMRRSMGDAGLAQSEKFNKGAYYRNFAEVARKIVESEIGMEKRS